MGMRGSVRCQLGGDETNTVDECHARQQCICEVCILTYALRSFTRVKTVIGLYYVRNLRLHLGEEIHAADCELKIHVKLYKFWKKKRRSLPVRVGVMDRDR